MALISSFSRDRLVIHDGKRYNIPSVRLDSLVNRVHVVRPKGLGRKRKAKIHYCLFAKDRSERKPVHIVNRDGRESNV